MDKKIEQIRPGQFGKTVSADARRIEFDFLNEQILYTDTKIDYLFVGDSITHYWNLNAYFKTSKHLENRGIGGDDSTYLLKRFAADCIQLHPKCVILMIGSNDIWRAEPDLWWKIPEESPEIVLEEYKSNVKEMIKQCEEAQIEVILCSVLPSTIAPPYNRIRRWEMTKQMNEFLMTQGKTYIDYHSCLTRDGRSLPNDLSIDGMHPNARGYAIMAEKLKASIPV